MDQEAIDELRTLPGDLAEVVARYLVASAAEEDPERALQYAQAARGLAARVGIVRETAAIAAYQAGNWAAALSEFRAARRLTGRDSYLPLMADSERGLGRMDRALDIVTGPEARAADRSTQIELAIVESGIRRDQGLPEAAVVVLKIPELTPRRAHAGSVRLFYAYADALLDAGREAEARDWFARAAAADRAGDTDAAERLDELDEIEFEDLDSEDLASEDPASEDLASEDPASEDPASEEPDSEEPEGLDDKDVANEDLVSTDQAIEAPADEDPAVGDSAMEDPAT